MSRLCVIFLVTSFCLLVYFVAIEQKIDLATRFYEDCDANKCEIVPSISNLWTRIAKYHC